MVTRTTDLKQLIVDRIAAAGGVWTPVDFLDLGSREAVDKALQRLASTDALRRIDRGLYDRPRFNPLTGTLSVPDYRRIIDAVGRRDQTRMLIDGMAAANDLGLSDAVPGQIVVHVDARLRPIHIGKQTIIFRPTAPSKLFWAGRPAMRVVQALHWLRTTLARPEDRQRIMGRLRAVLGTAGEGAAIAADLRQGLPTLPAWMQDRVRELLDESAAPVNNGVRQEVAGAARRDTFDVTDEDVAPDDDAARQLPRRRRPKPDQSMGPG